MPLLPHSNRLYGREMTARLTDLSGLLVIVFLTAYFSSVGYLIYTDYWPAVQQWRATHP